MDTTQLQIWKPILAYEGYYEINTLGNVRRKSRAKRKRKHTPILIGKSLSTRINNFGYVEVRLSKNGKTSTKFIHKLLGQVFIPNTENKPQINHKNGIKHDNRLENLEWVTNSENMIHAYSTGLLKKVVRPVIDNCSNHEYNNTKEAAKQCGINYFTLKNYLNGSRTNPTCLEYKKDA